MGLRIAIVGEPTKGKSTGIYPNKDINIKGLDPKSTILLTFSGKQPPIKHVNKMYPKEPKIVDGGNYAYISDVSLLPKIIKYISENRPEIKNIVLEDAQYSMSIDFMRRAKESGYGKFTDIGVAFANWMLEAQNAREDLKVYIIWHPEKDKDGDYKMKTVGNMVDTYLTPEGLMDIILYANCEQGSDGKMRYYFVTNNDGKFPARSPIGMFNEVYIPNDLGIVSDAIDNFYN